MEETTKENTLKSVEELKAKYGNEVVEAKVKELEEKLQGKVEELDETIFQKKEEVPETPNEEEIMQLYGLMTGLYISEGRLLRILDLQKNKQTKFIPREFRMRFNNLFVNNRVLMDYFHKRFNFKEVDYQNQLANSVEEMTNLFIACTQEDRQQGINDFKNFLNTKYFKKDGEELTTTDSTSETTGN